MFSILLTDSAPTNTSLGNTLVTLVAFIFLVYFIKRFTWVPFMKMLKDREDLINGKIQKANDDQEEARLVKSQAREILQDARNQANQMVLAAKKQSLQIQDSMIKDAKEEANSILTQAKHEIEQERAKILNEVKHELTDIAIEIAEKILHREVTDKDYHALIDDFIQGMDE